MAPISLDALKRPPIAVVFEGVTYSLAEATLEKIARVSELQQETAAEATGDPKASFDRLADLLAVLAPPMPADAIRRLEQAQAARLSEAGQEEATSVAERDGGDAKAVIEDPTSPG